MNGRIRSFFRSIGRSHPVSDLALWAAGLTFFSAIGIVPLVMEAISLAGRIVGTTALRRSMETLLRALPSSHGIGGTVRPLVDSSLELSWTQVAVLLVPTTVYGEGLRRSFLQMSHDHPNATTGWRGRVAFVPVIALTPFIVIILVAAIPFVAPFYEHGGWATAFGVVMAFHITFAMLTVVFAAMFRLVGTVAIPVVPLLIASACTASMNAGFLQGFLLFLAIPISWSAPFHGLPVVGAVTVLLLWLYVLNTLVIVGYRLALVLARR